MGRLAAGWLLYALGVLGLTECIDAAGYPEGAAWVAGAALGFIMLAWDREI